MPRRAWSAFPRPRLRRPSARRGPGTRTRGARPRTKPRLGHLQYRCHRRQPRQEAHAPDRPPPVRRAVHEPEDLRADRAAHRALVKRVLDPGIVGVILNTETPRTRRAGKPRRAGRAVRKLHLRAPSGRRRQGMRPRMAAILTDFHGPLPRENHSHPLLYGGFDEKMCLTRYARESYEFTPPPPRRGESGRPVQKPVVSAHRFRARLGPAPSHFPARAGQGFLAQHREQPRPLASPPDTPSRESCGGPLRCRYGHTRARP